LTAIELPCEALPWADASRAERVHDINHDEIVVFGRAAPHPWSYGTFARILGVSGEARPWRKALNHI
jgi:hypothetical protein